MPVLRGHGGSGTRLGRSPVKPAVEARIRALRAEGMGVLKIGRTVGVGTDYPTAVDVSMISRLR